MSLISGLRRQLIGVQERALFSLGAISKTRPILARVAFLDRCHHPSHTWAASVQPKVFPTVGFEPLPVEQPIEEENLPNYKAAQYYPAHIGQVLQYRYQIVGKVGYGGGSTVWACRDLEYASST